jgi:hypothetical protein
MSKKILTLVSLICLSGCSGATFEKGLNYEKTPKYSFDYDKGTHETTIRKNGEEEKYINIGFGTVACGYYGLIGPLVFPIIPFWENRDCDKIDIRIWEHRIGIKNTHVIYRDKIYEPSEISKTGYYTFPLQTKSITDTAILVVEKKDGQKFEIPFRYQHTFSFDLWPGR